MRVGIIGLGYVGLINQQQSHFCVERVVADAALVVDFRGVTRGIAAHNLIRL